MTIVILKNGKSEAFTDNAKVSYSKREGKVFVEDGATRHIIKAYDAKRVDHIEFTE